MTAQPKLDYSTLSETEVAGLCAGRDSGALRFVITANNQRLFRTAWSILKDRTDAEDAVQASYLSAFASIGSFEGRSSLATWLTRIVVNEAVGRLRSERRRRHNLEEQGVAVLESYRETLMHGSDPTAPDVAFAREQLRRLLEHAVAALPDPFRSVFVLREVEGLSVQETAEALELQPATVKTRLLRARRKLRETLAPEVKSALGGAFPFAGADCAALTDRVMKLLEDADQTSKPAA